MDDAAASLTAEADRATAAGDLTRAEQLLLDASAADPDDLGLCLRIAALQRATGRPKVALTAVHRALSIDPFDFTALLLRASLLQRLNDAGAAEAWSDALTQRPAGEIPPHLKQVVAEAEEQVERWTADRETKMQAATQASEASADPETRQRLQRFRSNVVRRTRHYHSEPTHFHFPGLAEREFFPRRLFPWLDDLERATETILSEMHEVMAAEHAQLVPYVQYPEHLPLEQWRELNNNRDWSAIHLLKNGERIEANARLCSNTMKLLSECNQPQVRGASPNAMFSLLAPKTAIPPHVGVANTRLVCHLPLIVPEGCWFRVGAETRFWKPGEAFVFDDTIEHEALNPTDQLRVVFIFDVWHPELSTIEREAVRALMEADGVPGARI